MYCANCGAKNADDDRFCQACGARLVNPNKPGRSTTLRDPRRALDQESQERLSLVDALYHTIDAAGISILGNPFRLLAYTSDLCDMDTPEYRVFELNCDQEVLRPFADLTSGTFDERALNDAENRTHLVLCDRSIDDQVAHVVSTCLRNAVARFASMPEVPIPIPIPPKERSSQVTSEAQVPNPRDEEDYIPPSASQSSVTSQAAHQEWSQGVAQHAAQQPYVQPPVVPPTPPQKSRVPIGLVALLVVLSITVGALAAMVFTNNNNGQEQTIGQSSGTSSSSETSTAEVKEKDSDSNAQSDSSSEKESKDTSEDDASDSSSSSDSSDSSASAPKASAPKASAKPSPADTFPRKWSGTYIGTSSYVQTSDHHITRAVAFHFTDVSQSGDLEGICYVGTADPGAGETYGTCYISGNVDWDTGEIYFRGTGWIDQGGLGDLREYSGSVDFSSDTMGGSAWDVGTGLYETPWNVGAVDTISILQNGSETVV